mmetsp:Transcript_8420/g.14279  ORF Transcript_8420/g.14279 Transcript_8420/m.14279 type:complete len:164 (+) Transcript_8420:57-548(+)
MIVDKNGRKRERSNAKCVELLDLEGNVLGVYPSGIAVASALGVQQGDISLCCRGLKYSVANHRFRFFGDPEDQFEVVKRRKLEMAQAAILEPPEDVILGGSGRSRRVSRGDYHVKVSDKDDHGKPSKNKHQYNGPKLTEIAHLKVRKWEKKASRVGTFQIKKW